MSEVRGPLPCYARIPDFLSEPEHQGLLEWAASNSDVFKPAKVFKAGKREFQLDPERRIAGRTTKIGPLEPLLRDRFLAVLPELMAVTGVSGPEPTSLELEMTAYQNGAYFRPHRDISIGPSRDPIGAQQGEDRILSAIYYFHSQPKAFSGGELRLFGFGSVPQPDEKDREYIDVEPLRNSLVAFPSWAPHEVRPVVSPTNNFADSRFALNCWYCRSLLSN